MPRLRLVASVLLALTGGLAAQTCASGDVLLKNDILPAVPVGAFPVGVVPGLCEGEAAMAVLTTPGACYVRKVSVMFGDFPLGTPGITAAVDIEIYDGAVLNGNGTYTLGPLVWSLSGNTGNNLQIQTHAINEFDIPGNVRVTSNHLVVGWRMVLTTSAGSCLTGYFANFATDASSNCVAGRNVYDALPPIGTKVDPMTYDFSAIGNPGPICGGPYWRGDWIIRACVTPDVSVNWTGNATPGGAVLLNLLAPGHPSEFYLTLLSLGTAPGTPTPWGLLPLNADFLMFCSVDPSCAMQVLVNGSGHLNLNSQSTAVLLIPNLPFLYNSNFTLYAGFVTSLSAGLTPFTAVSAPSPAIIIN